MKNITLDLETLAVESFTTDEVQNHGPGDLLESCIPEDCGPQTTDPCSF